MKDISYGTETKIFGEPQLLDGAGSVHAIAFATSGAAYRIKLSISIT
jgi:hypothetical protein